MAAALHSIQVGGRNSFGAKDGNWTRKNEVYPALIQVRAHSDCALNSSKKQEENCQIFKRNLYDNIFKFVKVYQYNFGIGIHTYKYLKFEIISFLFLEALYMDYYFGSNRVRYW